MNLLYSTVKIDIADLQTFCKIAWDVLRSTQYGQEFSNFVMLIALCQGGANHYVVTQGIASRYFEPKKAGLKDIDIWFFFNNAGFHPLWRQTCDLGPGKFGKSPEDLGYCGRRMEFFGRSIPFQPEDDIKSALLRWLQKGKQKPKSSPWYLAQKAIVALYPENIIGDVLWVNPAIM